MRSILRRNQVNVSMSSVRSLATTSFLFSAELVTLSPLFHTQFSSALITDPSERVVAEMQLNNEKAIEHHHLSSHSLQTFLD